MARWVVGSIPYGGPTELLDFLLSYMGGGAYNRKEEPM